jgi:hypothetical protein
MTKTTRKNITVKALQSHLASLEKSPINHDDIRMERKLIGAVNNRGENLSCEDVRRHCESYLDVLGRGATKIAYGTEHLAICFIRDAYDYDCGNQIALQVKAWEQIALTEEAKFFNPVLSYGLHRGDKLSDTDTRFLNKSFIVSPKASFYGGIKEAIINAYKLNHIDYNADMVQYYFNDMMEAARKYNIGDLHCENIGVIFDYSIGKYRAVITDYGLTRY